jgi:hypothetical protein
MWRDIPAQVIVKRGRTASKQPLSERFAQAIDRAAMRAKLHGTDGYLSQWHRDSVPCDDDLQAVLAATVAQLEAEYTDEVLVCLIAAGGMKPA